MYCTVRRPRFSAYISRDYPVSSLIIFAFLSCRLPYAARSASLVSTQTHSFIIGANISLFHPSMSTTDQEGQLNMPPSNRSAWRDTTIYASDNRDKVLGGLCATEGITNDNLYSMIEIFCFFTDTFTLHNDNGELVERDGQKLKPGNYYIATNGNSFPHSLVSKFLALGLVPQRKRTIMSAIKFCRGTRTFGTWLHFHH